MLRSSNLLLATLGWAVLMSGAVAYTPTISSAQARAWDEEILASGKQFTLETSEPYYVVPGSSLPDQVKPQLSNNCLGLESYNGTMFLGFRSAPYHFASNNTVIYVMSSQDNGLSWEYETEFELRK